MRSLAPPADDALGLYSELSQRARGAARAFLLAATSEIAARYGEYQALVVALEPIAPMGPADGLKRGLLNNYKRLATHPTDVYDRLKSAAGRYCPICLFGIASDSLDHFLPKAVYAEFATLPVNLIPCCFRCNLNKRTEKGLNPYFHYVGEQPLYSVRFDWTNLAEPRVVYSLLKSKPAQLSDRVWIRYRTLAQKARLPARFSAMAIDELADIASALQVGESKNSPSDKSGELATDSANHRAKRAFGPHHWKTMLLGALAADTWFARGGYFALDFEPIS